MEDAICLQRISDYLSEIKDMEGRNRKLCVMFNMFKYIVRHRQLMFSHLKFMDVTRSKLRELYFKENWELAAVFYEQLFATRIEIVV